MSSIKSLADELRETIKAQETISKTPEKQQLPANIEAEKSPATTKKTIAKSKEKETVDFFEALDSYQLTGSEKLLIRLDTRTVNLLKQLKLAKGIDMNRFIAFSLARFLEEHPWLSPYIKETLKNTDL